jgi:hypothetical protein
MSVYYFYSFLVVYFWVFFYLLAYAPYEKRDMMDWSGWIGLGF